MLATDGPLIGGGPPPPSFAPSAGCCDTCGALWLPPLIALWLCLRLCCATLGFVVVPLDCFARLLGRLLYALAWLRSWAVTTKPTRCATTDFGSGRFRSGTAASDETKARATPAPVLLQRQIRPRLHHYLRHRVPRAAAGAAAPAVAMVAAYIPPSAEPPPEDTPLKNGRYQLGDSFSQIGTCQRQADYRIVKRSSCKRRPNHWQSPQSGQRLASTQTAWSLRTRNSE